ncbi:MAG: hypothetical protein AAGG02_13070 [Cyanobacteria bacterium P01_H01_bin.15]
MTERICIIEININNDQKRVADLRHHFPDSNLEFANQYLYQATKQYQEQLILDQQIFSEQLPSLTNLTETIETILTIEQTPIEQTLNQATAITGVGIGTATVTSTLISPVSKKVVEQFQLPQNSFAAETLTVGVSLTSSFLVGIICSVLTAVFLGTQRP